MNTNHCVVYPPFNLAAHLWDGTHLKGDRQRLVAPPVGGQDRAEKVGAVGPDQLGRVVGDDLRHAAVFVGTQSWHRRRCVRLPGWRVHIVHLPWDRLEAIGRRTEPPTGAGIYGNSHHNSVDYQKRHQRLSSSSLSFSLTHSVRNSGVCAAARWTSARLPMENGTSWAHTAFQNPLHYKL